MIFSEAIQAANSLALIVPLLGGSTTRKDYDEAMQLVEYLLEKEPDSPLIDMLSSKIEAYENSAPEFSAFNERISGIDTGVAVLRTLMDQHGLKQVDLENEIGQRSLVSRVLKGERSLTIEAIRKLSARFKVPVSAFIG